MEKRFCSVFNVDEYLRITSGVKFAQCMIQAYPSLQESPSSEDLERRLKDIAVSEAHSCSCCGAQFSDAAAQRNHFKLDWHRYNIKRQLSGFSAIKEEAFDNLADNDDMESISGSESESDAATDESAANSKNVVNITRHAKIFFENGVGQVFSLYRNILLRRKEEIDADSDAVINLVREVPNRNMWAVVMIGGGHFAASVFRGNEPILHKTFHSYTVRAKQGGSQSSRDGRGSHPKSAGASLRRYNEQMLLQHIQDIVGQWKEELKSCHLIFYRAVGPQNRGILFDGKAPPFEKTDERLRSIPFPTRRATFNEVKRVHSLLSTMETHGLVTDIQSSVPKSSPKKVHNEAKKESDALPDGVPARRPRAKSGTPKIDRARSRPSPNRPPPVELVSSSESETAAGYELTCSEIEIPSNLEEYGDSFNQDGVLSTKERKDGYLRREWMKRLQATDELKKREAEEEAEKARLIKAKEKERKKLAAEKKAAKAAAEALKRQMEAEEIANDPLKKFRMDLIEVISEGDPVKLRECLESAKDRNLAQQLASVLNSAVDGNNPALHIAARAGHPQLIGVLLDAGANPCRKNKKLQVAYAVSLNKETQKAFCTYMQQNPSRYSYAESQIPPPLSEEEAREIAEKKAAALKAKRMRVKEKKKKEEMEKKENEERTRFLALSDREKRALAAERRILAAQASGSTSSKPLVLSRCYFCATDITGAVPFEYDQYRFCSMDCLKGHRLKAKTTSAMSVG